MGHPIDNGLFDCGRQNLHDDSRSGRPPIDHLDAKSTVCLEREQFSSADSLAETLDVSPATVLSRLRNLLGMKIFHLGRVPDQLIDNLRQCGSQNAVSFFARWRLCSEPIFATLSQAMRVGFASSTSTPHNGRSLAMNCLKGWTRYRHH
jgi:hypothetical protein